MTKQDLYTVAIKIFGLFYLTKFIQDSVETVYFVIGGMNAATFEGSWTIYVSIFLKTLLDFVVFYLATLKTELVISRVFKGENNEIQLTLNKPDWLELSIAILGIVLVVGAIPDLLNLFVAQVYFKTNPEEFGIPRDKASMFYNAFQLIVGVFIILNARNFAKKIVKRGEEDDKQDEGGKGEQDQRSKVV